MSLNFLHIGECFMFPADAEETTERNCPSIRQSAGCKIASITGERDVFAEQTDFVYIKRRAVVNALREFLFRRILLIPLVNK